MVKAKSLRLTGTVFVAAWMADVTRDGLRRKALLAVHVLRLNNFTVTEVIDKLLKMIEIEKDAPGGGANTESMLENEVTKEALRKKW